MSNYAHPEVLASSEWVAMGCNSNTGHEVPDEAELMALLDSVMPTLRSWAAPPAALASMRRAA
jgi:hypothetical protein